MATFNAVKEINKAYANLAARRRGCIRDAETLIDYLKTQGQGDWTATIKRLRIESREAKKVMNKKDW
jgi:hypothetical protein